MMAAPDQLLWTYDESWAATPMTSEQKVVSFRGMRARQRGWNHPLWALIGERVVGMIGINVPGDAARQHCGEIGFGVAKKFTGRGIGRRLISAAIEKARLLGLRRLEADCFADNAASVALLDKCGFREEGPRTGAILKNGRLRDQRLFGLML